MVANPKKRITILEILEDPWFSKGYEVKDSNTRLVKDNLDVKDVIEEIQVTDEEKVKKKLLKPFNAFEVIHLMSSPSEIKSENTFLMKGDYEFSTNYIADVLKEMKAKKVDIKENHLKVAFGKDDQSN
jgi:alpha-acetolactate decarboxylase